MTYACALAQTAPLLSKPRDKAMASFRRVLPFVALYLGVFDWKVQRFCWPKGTSLQCAESIYVEAACVSDELCRLKEEEEEEIVSLACKAFTRQYSYLKHANS